MKTLKHLLVATAILIITFLLTRWTLDKDGINPYSAILFLGLILLFTFNFMASRMARFKPYFMSNYNIFSSKYRTEIEYDIPRALMFDKVIEVLKHSNFKIKGIDKDNFEIFAQSSISFKSWRENIYIDLKENNGKTLLIFGSAAIGQMYAWGKNEENYELLMQKFEESLII